MRAPMSRSLLYGFGSSLTGSLLLCFALFTLEYAEATESRLDETMGLSHDGI